MVGCIRCPLHAWAISRLTLTVTGERLPEVARRGIKNEGFWRKQSLVAATQRGWRPGNDCSQRGLQHHLLAFQFAGWHTRQ